VRAVLDVNVLISAAISPSGSPAKLVRAWAAGEFELIVSPALLEELRRALGYPKVAHLIAADDAELLIAWLSRSATLVLDAASSPPVRCPDPDDDYLIAMAAEQNAVLVTGDRHLLAVAGSFPIHEPSDFLAMLARLET
jgi:putative PIN family toxin of toxin-antitoxin system